MLKNLAWKILCTVGSLISAASAAAILYFGVFYMFIGGIIQIVEALKQTDINASDVAGGIARVFFTGIGTFIVAFSAVFGNLAMWTVIGASKPHQPRRW